MRYEYDEDNDTYHWMIVCIRIIDSENHESLNIDGDKINGGIVIDYPIENLEEDCDDEDEVDKTFNILLYKIDRNKYAYVSGTLKIIE